MRGDYIRGMGTWEASARRHRGGWRWHAALLVLALVVAVVSLSRGCRRSRLAPA